MSKLTDVITYRRHSRNHSRRRYTDVDMAVIKHDEAVLNSRVARGEAKAGNTQLIIECGCGTEGCFLHIRR